MTQAQSLSNLLCRTVLLLATSIVCTRPAQADDPCAQLEHARDAAVAAVDRAESNLAERESDGSGMNLEPLRLRIRQLKQQATAANAALTRCHEQHPTTGGSSDTVAPPPPPERLPTPGPCSARERALELARAALQRARDRLERRLQYEPEVNADPLRQLVRVASAQEDAARGALAKCQKAPLPPPAMGPVEAETICQGAANSWYGRATIKQLSNGIQVMIYYHASGHAANDGALHVRFSTDHGATWTAEDKCTDGSEVKGFPMNPSGALPGEDAGEPWLMIAPNGDLLLHMWCITYGASMHGTYQSRSTDGGRTWSPSAKIDWVEAVGDDYIFATDDDFVLDGVIYIAARVFNGVGADQCRTTFNKSTDNGVTWHEVSSISNYGLGQDTQEAGLEYVGNNTIVAVLRSLDDKQTYTTRSTNMGTTWAPLTNITSTLTNSGRHRIRTRSHLKGFKNWWEDPVLIMNGFTQPPNGKSTPRRNCVWVSLDKGLNWSPPFLCRFRRCRWRLRGHVLGFRE
jgi:BNR repeat protein